MQTFRRVRVEKNGQMTRAQHIFLLIPGVFKQFLSRHFNRGCFRITQPLCSRLQTVHPSTKHKKPSSESVISPMTVECTLMFN